jgi:chromosome segregation ATPase
MSGTTNENHRDNADLALVVFLEEAARGKRVLLVGETAPRVERRLSDAARTVDVVSRERRTRSSRRGLPVRAWPSASEKGAWDVVVVPDLAAAGLLDASAFAEIATLVGPGGALVVAIDASTEGARYEAFYELVSPHFPSVRVFGQAPMSGYALVDFAVGSPPEVAFDGSAAGNTSASRWIAIAADGLALDPYAIIAVPEVVASQVSAAPAPSEPRFEREAEAAKSRLDHAEKRLEQAQREIARGAQKLDEARHERERMAAELRENIAAAEAAAAYAASVAEDPAAMAEYDDLEARLVAAGRETTMLRVELERRAVLVRDLVEEARALREAGRSGVGLDQSAVDAELGRLRDALVVAQRRAVDAETRSAELGFRSDELATDLAAVGQRHEAERQRLVTEQAATEGTVRGLVSRLAELNDVRLVSEGRLALVEDDLRRAKGREAALERSLALASERLAVAMMRPPEAAGPSSAASDETSEREGKLFGALLRAREDLGDVTAERTVLLGEVARLRTSLEIVTHETERQHEAAAGRVERVESDLALRDAQLAERNEELSAERERRRAAEGARDEALARMASFPDPSLATFAESAAATEIARLETEIESLRGERTGLSLRVDDTEAALDALRESVAALKSAESTAGQSESRARGELTDERRRTADLAARLGARDALISRLSSSLAHAGETRAALERAQAALDVRLAAATESIGTLEAVSSVRADEERREKEELAKSVTRLEVQVSTIDADRAQADEALRDVRETLARLENGLGQAKSPLVPGGSDAVLQEHVARLGRDMEDREVMLRSLTAQLEERDDRIRALERLARGERVSGDASRLLEADERITRLTSELAEERRARQSAESGSALVSREVDLRRLEQLVGDREAQLMLLEGRVDAASREEKQMRDAFADARAGLETILGDLGNDRQGRAAERLADLLRSLRRY